MQRAAIRISQGPVRSGFITPKVRIQSKRGAGRKSAPSIGSPAFLTQKIVDIRPSEEKGLSRLGIDIQRSYEHLQSCCKRFLKFVGQSYDFECKSEWSKGQAIGELIDWFEKKIKPLGLEFFVGKKSPNGDEVDVLECAVYRYGYELSDRIVVMYVSPARYLSTKSAEFFKRFMKFFSQSTHIPLGVIDNSENFYIDAVLSMYEDDPFYDEYDEDAKELKEIAAKYKQDGEFWNLFDEIHCLPPQNEMLLYEQMNKYRKECPDNEVELIECLMEGLSIVKDMNSYWFDFNPEDDGLPDAYGKVDGEGWASCVFASAILYSEQDSICERLLDCVNNDVNSGIEMSGWNIHQYLSPQMRKADIMDFMRCKDRVADFNKWLRDFYNNIEDFDKYGKS